VSPMKEKVKVTNSFPVVVINYLSALLNKFIGRTPALYLKKLRKISGLQSPIGSSALGGLHDRIGRRPSANQTC
jgi:hypothetical protein